jgi:tetratricopeptide (TPR) repeat protein
MNSTRKLHISSLLFISFLLAFSPLSYSQENDLQKAKSLNQQWIKLYTQGRYSEAIPISEKALAIREKAVGLDHPDVPLSLNNLAVLYDSLGDYAKAEPLYKRSLVIYEKALGPEHPYVAAMLENMAELYKKIGKKEEAETFGGTGQKTQ